MLHVIYNKKNIAMRRVDPEIIILNDGRLLLQNSLCRNMQIFAGNSILLFFVVDSCLVLAVLSWGFSHVSVCVWFPVFFVLLFHSFLYLFLNHGTSRLWYGITDPLRTNSSPEMSCCPGTHINLPVLFSVVFSFFKHSHAWGLTLKHFGTSESPGCPWI